MRFWFQILLITGVTVGLSGCDVISGFLPGGGEDDVATTTEVPVAADPNAADPNAADPNATDPNAADPNAADPNAADPNAADPNAADPNATDPNATDATQTEDAGAIFEEPVIIGSTSGDLIQPTSAEERIQQVERDRPDPFDILQTTPTIEIPDDVVLVPPTDDLEIIDSVDPDEDVLLPELEPIELPPPPEPVTARAVAVTGVVQIGSVPYAIVNAPNEPHSRYVRSGQLLSNGQVLVKRIEFFPGVADPVVVLEELGMEVTRQVGDVPETPGTTPEADQIDV